MKKSLILTMFTIMFLVFGCMDPQDWNDQKLTEQRLKYAHEEKMAEIKARGAGTSQKDKEQLADMIADKVVERLKQEQQ